MDTSKIPGSMKTAPRWLCWLRVPNEKKGRPDKVPVAVRNGPKVPAGKVGGHTTPANWGTLDEALRLSETSGAVWNPKDGRSYPIAGVGFALGGGWVGVDLDHVRDADTGKLDPEAAELLGKLNSYSEVSQSGTGTHTIVRADPDFRPSAGECRPAGSIAELYTWGRFFTVTGSRMDEYPVEVEERTAEVKALASAHSKKADPKQASQLPKAEARKGSAAVSYDPALLSDRDILERLFNDDGRWQRLYDGDCSGYTHADGSPDQNRADLALCEKLAFYTGLDMGRVDSLFRRSGLYRDKWERPDYRASTLEKACDYARNDLQRSAGRAFGVEAGSGFRAEAGSDIPKAGPAAEAAQASAEGAADFVPYARGIPPEPLARIMTTVTYMDAEEDGFSADVAKLAPFRDRKTGFVNLDTVGPFLPGLYVLGAATSLGKTTFAWQLGEQLAAAGNDVIYFSLEMSRSELLAKSLSRTMYRLNPQTARTAAEILRGFGGNALETAKEAYRGTVSNHMHFVRLRFNAGVTTMLRTVDEYAQSTGSMPVVILDYLQAAAHPGRGQSVKDAVDADLGQMKEWAGANTGTIFLLSSVNRANYLTPVDFESFKETGGIEFYADVAWGLDLACLSNELFDQQGHIIEKRMIVAKARAANPRLIRLRALKNRNGVSNFVCSFAYHTHHNLFEPRVNDSGEWVTFGGSASPGAAFSNLPGSDFEVLPPDATDGVWDDADEIPF